MATLRLGELLVAKQKLTNEQLKKALQAQMIWGGHLGTNLIELGYITEDELGEVLAEAHAVRYAPYSILQEIPSSVLESIPRGLVEKYKLVPFRFDGKKLHLVMLQPQDLVALDEVSFATGFQLVPYVTPEIRLFQVLEKYYNIPRARRYITLTREMSLRDKKEGHGGPRPAPSILDSPADVRPFEPREEPPEPPPAPAAGPQEAAGSPEEAEKQARGLMERSQDDIDPYASTPATDWTPSDAGRDRRAAPPPAAPPPPGDQAAGRRLVPEELPAGAAAERDPGLDRLLKARSLDEICRTLVEESAATFRRCAVFARNGDALVSVTGLAASSESWSIGGLALPFDLAAVESLFADGRTFYIGPPPGGAEERSFYESLGGPPPPNAFLAPVRLNEKIALVFYGDQEAEEVRPGEVDSILSMVQQASLALDLLSLRRKDSPE